MMKASKLAVASAITAALATGALAPAAAAAEYPPGGSAMWLHDTLVSNLMNTLDQLHGGPDAHPSEKFAPMMLSSAPFLLLLYPLQLLAETEVRLQLMFSSQYQ